MCIKKRGPGPESLYGPESPHGPQRKKTKRKNKLSLLQASFPLVTSFPLVSLFPFSKPLSLKRRVRIRTRRFNPKTYTWKSVLYFLLFFPPSCFPLIFFFRFSRFSLGLQTCETCKPTPSPAGLQVSTGLQTCETRKPHKFVRFAGFDRFANLRNP